MPEVNETQCVVTGTAQQQVALYRQHNTVSHALQLQYRTHPHLNGHLTGHMTHTILSIPGKRSRDVTLPCRAISLAVADLKKKNHWEKPNR